LRYIFIRILNISASVQLLPVPSRYYSGKVELKPVVPKPKTSKESKDYVVPPPPIDLNSRRKRLAGIIAVGFSLYLVAIYIYEKAELERKWLEAKKAKAIKVEPLPYLKEAPPVTDIARKVRFGVIVQIEYFNSSELNHVLKVCVSCRLRIQMTNQV